MNQTAKVIRIIGIIVIISGVVIGIANGMQVIGYEESIIPGEQGDPVTEFSFFLFLTYALSGLISGYLLIGFSELINLSEKSADANEAMREMLRRQEKAEWQKQMEESNSV